jgi:DNA (cytosine-5)-methyltransferase 1
MRVGTDCSGIEAPIQALIGLKIPFTHEFSSDIDKQVIKSIKANYNPGRLYGDPDGPFPDGDITKRDNSTLPDIDLYICGFPCQPFSLAGNRKGISDSRGTVFWSCINVISCKQPAYFILENVKGLISIDNGKVYETILQDLETLGNKYNYSIHVRVLNTRDYGIPQNRERLFIIGIKYNSDYEFPCTIKMKNLSEFVDWKNTNRELKTYTLETNYHNVDESTSLFIDVNFIKLRRFNYSHIYSPCLNTGGGLWNVPLHRYASVKEYLKLQGFPLKFKQVVSDSRMKKQIGNSMSVNVLNNIFKTLLRQRQKLSFPRLPRLPQLQVEE